MVIAHRMRTVAGANKITGKEVFVVGGGFAAAEESVFLTKYASHVTILIRGDDFTCAKATADEARENENITVLTNTTVEKVEGDSVLRSITYKNTKTGERTVYTPENGDTFGVFVFAGYSPSTALIPDLPFTEFRADMNLRRSCWGFIMSLVPDSLWTRSRLVRLPRLTGTCICRSLSLYPVRCARSLLRQHRGSHP